MHITDTELSKITALNHFTVGSTYTGNVHVDALTDGSTDKLGTITLLATKQSKLVVFEPGHSTFNKGIVVQAMGGVVLSSSLTTTSSPTVIQTGTGSLTVVASKTLSSSSQLLTVTADDVSLTGGVSTGTTTLILECMTAGRTVGLGTATAQLNFADGELGQITATGMTIGGPQCGSQTVTGVTAANSDMVTTILTLLASRDDTQVTFVGATSTFNILSVQADDGILVKGNLVTDGPSVRGAGASGVLGPSQLFLDGNLDRAVDSNDAVSFTDARTIRAKTVLTLASYQGTVVPAGTMTLAAGSGIVLLDHITGQTASKPMVINSDYDSHGDGTLTITESESCILC
jgi:hypothetical protein